MCYVQFILEDKSLQSQHENILSIETLYRVYSSICQEYKKWT